MPTPASLGGATASAVETLLYCIKNMSHEEQEKLKTTFNYKKVAESLCLASKTSDQGLHEKMTELFKTINKMPDPTTGAKGRKIFPPNFEDRDTETPAGPSTRAVSARAPSVLETAPLAAGGIMNNDTTPSTASSSKGKGKEPASALGDLVVANQNLDKAAALLGKSFEEGSESITMALLHARDQLKSFTDQSQQQLKAFESAVLEIQQQLPAVNAVLPVAEQQYEGVNANVRVAQQQNEVLNVMLPGQQHYGTGNAPFPADQQHYQTVNAVHHEGNIYPNPDDAMINQQESVAIQAALEEQFAFTNAARLAGNDNPEADEANNRGNDA